MVARLERDKVSDRRTSGAATDSPNDSDKSADYAKSSAEAAIAIEQFRRLTAEEAQAALENDGAQKQTQEPQQIRYSARIQVASAISRETFILQRKLAAIIDRTQDIEIKRLLKALHQKYICLDVRELGSSRTYIEELIEKTNAYLARIASTAKTDLNPIIHLRNGYVLVGPIKGYEPVYVIDNEETRKAMHYSGVKISKPDALPEPTSPTISPKNLGEAAPEKGSYLYCVRSNRDKFRGKLADKDYEIAEGIAQAVDLSSPALGAEGETTISALEKKLKIADYTIIERLGKIGRIFKRIGITLEREQAIDDDGTDVVTLFWTASLESDFGAYEPVEKEGEDGDSDKDEDDEDDGDKSSARGKRGARGQVPSKGNVEYLKKKENPNDIFPAFRGVEFTTAAQFNKMIVETLTGDKGICTYERDASSDDARKLMRSINACKVADSIKDRVNGWKRTLFLGIQRSKKYGCLYRGSTAVLLKGIEAKDDEV